MSIVKTLAIILTVLLAHSQQPAFGSPPTTKPDTPRETFHYAGDVVDPQGRPVAGVQVTATHRDPGGESYAYIATVQTDAKGRFSINQAIAQSGAEPTWVIGDIIRLEFLDKNYAYARLEDLSVLSQPQLTDLHIKLQNGRSLRGRVVEPGNKPVSNASVEITFGKQYELRRAVVSDANGRFEIKGLPLLKGELAVLTTQPSQPMMSETRPVESDKDEVGDVTLASIDLPRDSVIHQLFGMKLIDVDPSIQKSFHLPRADGVLIIDPGPQSERLNIGKLQRGDQFWIVGDRPIKNVEDFKKSLSNEARLVYLFRRPDMAGSNTQYIKLSDADLAELAK
jgi:hypothetical protein